MLAIKAARPAGLPSDVELRLVKPPLRPPAAGRDPAVAAKVSEMLLRIEREGMDAVRAYSRELDGWDPPVRTQRIEVGMVADSRQHRHDHTECSAPGLRRLNRIFRIQKQSLHTQVTNARNIITSIATPVHPDVVSCVET